MAQQNSSTATMVSNPLVLSAEDPTSDSSVLYRQLRQKPLNVVKGQGSYLTTDGGLEIFDATCGAAVSCLGHSDERVCQAIAEQLQKIPYCYSLYFTNDAAERLSTFLSNSTGGKMSRAFIVSSGSYLPLCKLFVKSLTITRN